MSNPAVVQVPVTDFDELRVWYALNRHQNSGFGAEEEGLIEKTGLERERLLGALNRLMNNGFVEQRLQQVGTGGSMHRYYTFNCHKYHLTFELDVEKK
jgi:predicted transcriptional regulator